MTSSNLTAGGSANGVDTERLRKVGKLLLPVIAYGDAAGAPYEGEPAQPNKGRLVPYDTGLFGIAPAGQWTDDTQLSVAMARSLIVSGEFDLDRIAHEHAVQLRTTPVRTMPSGVLVALGWGGSTVSAVDLFMKGTPPSETGSPGGAGNGVLMKVAPLVWWQSACGTSAQQSIEEIDALTGFTHDSAVARVCSRVHGTVLRFLLEHGGDPEEIVSVALRAAHAHEENLAAPTHISEELQYLKGLIAGDCEQHVRSKVCGLSVRARNLYGFYAPETLAAVYGAYLQWGGRRRFDELIYNAISLGGDTDSTASMIAAMALFGAGGDIDMPADIETVHKIEDLRLLSAKLATTAVEGRKTI